MIKWIARILLIAVPCVALANPGNTQKDYNAKFDKAFDILDADKSKSISKAEAQLKSPEIAANFEQMDTNHNGSLTKKEIKEAVALAEKRRIEFSQNLEKADKDNNGRLTREEANALPNISANFDAIDSNLDGELVIQEIMDYLRGAAKTKPAK